jgi:hypothetical protein
VRRVVAASVVVALSACGPKPPTTGVAAGDAIVYIKSNVGDAALYVDGRYVRPVRMVRGGIAVVPGKHRIELRHDDYFSRYIELELARAEKKTLDVTLAPILP